MSPEVEVDLGNNKGAPYQSFMLLIDEAEAALAKVNRTDIPYYIFIDELEAYYGNRQIFERDLALIRISYLQLNVLIQYLQNHMQAKQRSFVLFVAK